MSKKQFHRTSGVVMPIFSLPSPYGIGTMGQAAYDFIDWLVEADQRYWQILPLGHTNPDGNSPYQSYSSVAGNPNLIDLDMLVKIGLLKRDFADKVYHLDYNKYLFNSDFEWVCERDDRQITDECKLNHMLDKTYGNINYNKLNKVRLSVLYDAYLTFKEKGSLKESVERFVYENTDWLPDYAMFMALRRRFGNLPMYKWDNVVKRSPSIMYKYRVMLKDEINFFIFIQYLFFYQWKRLKKYANSRGILFIGDIPFYPSPDSADVWANPHLFKVDEICRPNGIAGVPPDDYSSTGQLWGNPTYNWEEHEKDGFSWWINRLEHTNDLFDVIRIDHFRAFQDYWEAPKGETTAINGKWLPGPRMKFFKAIKDSIGNIPLIAEDLGLIDKSVHNLLRKTGYPGMRSIIWGLRAYESNIHHPINYQENVIAYTSTHDSETFCQMVNNVMSKKDKEYAMKYLHKHSDETLGFAAIRAIMASPAVITMLMAPDILSLGAEGRINVPGTVSDNNWAWRAKPGDFTKELAAELRNLTTIYKRSF